MKKPKFELFHENSNGWVDYWYFHLKAPNGRTILASETYQSKAGALNGIKSIQKNAAIAEVVEL